MPLDSIKFRNDGAWGVGTGTGPEGRLTSLEADTNAYTFQTAIEALQDALGDGANNITAITSEAASITFHFQDGSTIGPLALPVLQFRFRGEWIGLSSYLAFDGFTRAGVGLFSVLVDHTAAATFDPEAVAAAATAGSFMAGRRYVILTTGTTDFTAIGAVDNNPGTVFVALGAGSGTGTAAAKLYNLIFGAGALGALLDDLVDVVITTPADGDFLIFQASSSHWINTTGTGATAHLAVFVGDTGTGGVKGLVPAPATGDAAIDAFLGADGNWRVPVLADLDDVAASPGDGQVLVFDADLGKWIAADVAGVSGTLNSLTDVDITSPAGGQSLVFDTGSGHWINGAASLANSGVAAGTYVLATITVDLQGRITSAANGSSAVNSAALDAAFGSTRGSMLYRGVGGWLSLPAASSPGQLLEHLGPGNDPHWASVTGVGSNLSALTDVTITAPAASDFLMFDNITAQWINRGHAAATARLDTFAPDTGTGGAKGLVPAPAAGDATKFLGGDGAFHTIAGAFSTLGALTDVTITSVVDRQHLRYDAATSEWINALDGFFSTVLVRDRNHPIGANTVIENYADTQSTAISFPNRAFRQAGGTPTAPAAITSTAVLGADTFYGWDGTDWGLGATVQARATENWSGTAHGAELWFSITPNGSTTATFPLRLRQDGKLELNGTVISTGHYSFAFSSPQTTPYSTDQVLGHHTASTAITIPANFGGYFGRTSQASGSAHATASTVIRLQKCLAANDPTSPGNWTTIGTITFAVGTVTPTFATTGGVDIALAQADHARVIAPTTPDATFAGFSGNIVAHE